MSHLELAGLAKRYGDFAAVDDVSLSVEKGLLVCLLGPSGCGKTTTLRLIAGFIKPTAGEIRVEGKVISATGWAEPPERRSMSMIFQSYALWPHMTISENVAYGLTLRKLPARDIAAKVQEVLSITQLVTLADRYPGELSGGQQQRVSLARALVVEPDILLLDEPLSNLDANLREDMRFEIRRLHDRYRYTTVYVTHDQTEAMTTADVIVVMNGGRIEQAGTPLQIYKEPKSQFVARFIGGTNILKARLAGDVADCGDGLVLRCENGADLPAGGIFVAIRHHDVEMRATMPDDSYNVAEGMVTRHVYLGPYRDYVVTLASGVAIRVLAPASIEVAVGRTVWLHFPPDHCRALPH
ncbi:ABC transporter ATP-binding protein [Methylovirgula sp. 4M-Z18]|uniref:ABC transporter ATP-binding protein n=1 Tax=Methylovirgula sp. 4M-Z18 TaxID=2293567 RepID=UPI000E2FCDED|nr:ABC transporter ATP-binding protein [Methylovirgula sp. 4M-Z18]RFB79785.1 ABC transporter ATP-binding protein [Methylovirgula sp. 4M-Z18]